MFMNWKVTAHLAAFSGLAALVGLHHGTPDAGASQAIALVQVLDGNGDGVLSADEIDAAPASLRSLDANGDGSVCHRELIAHAGTAAPDLHGAHTRAGHHDFTREEMLAALHHLLQADVNEDGVLDRNEVLHAAHQAADSDDLPCHDLEPDVIVQMIMGHDTDGNGLVERAELLQQAHDVMSVAEDSEVASGRHGAHTSKATTDHPVPTGVGQIEDHFWSFDGNGDGKLDKKEVPAQGLHLFDDGDTNSDGRLDRAEVRALAELFFEMHNPQASKDTGRIY